jgi:hypothetical protein
VIYILIESSAQHSDESGNIRAFYDGHFLFSDESHLNDQGAEFIFERAILGPFASR